MDSKTNIETLMQVKQFQMNAIQTIGFRGDGPQDEQKLFAALKARKVEIPHRINEHEYLIISPDGLYAAAAVSTIGIVPEGMVQITIPADGYQVFRFEEKYIGDFWDFFCNKPAQDKYNLNVDKIRFEIFKEDLQPQGVTEIYFPING
ncbi:effector binding domain-containing protein [Paenibacillus eucommiae]|uniref:Transcriptional regulator YdeE n=1 Tax=Paenibacillus eucommiae TaxID=1355755 RepID=A0ABS4J4Y6_9BACL|nr:effector binding domain-containing protein [Paenibacillus eucommiae]MBP1994875.1 putative transcriptional regulator YdeE [Paenibacillus eucommiae]